MEEEKPLVATLLKLGLGVFGAESSASVAFPDVSAFLSAMADAIAGFLVHEGLEELQELILEKLAESALEDCIPYVDIFFQIANRAVDLVEIAETTVEVLTSPAVYEVDILRTLNLVATVSPDPTHGTSENAAIWPQGAATWEAVVQYKGGTSHSQTGIMPAPSTTSAPVTVTFDALPAGGSLQLKFNVYSATGFLCGQFTSAWQPAVLPSKGETITIVGSIQEKLVPLSAETVYQYKQKLVYNGAAAAHMWQPSQFTIDPAQASSLDSGQVSPTIGTVFEQNACVLEPSAVVDVLNPGTAWTITDKARVYRIALKQLVTGGKTTEVLVVSTANVPLQVVTDLSADNAGHNLAKLVNITVNDKAYMLGYSWRASGQDIPETGGKYPVSEQIYAFQNINVLANPEASLKFSPSGFVNQPAIVYDQFGRAAVQRPEPGVLGRAGQRWGRRGRPRGIVQGVRLPAPKRRHRHRHDRRRRLDGRPAGRGTRLFASPRHRRDRGSPLPDRDHQPTELLRAAHEQLTGDLRLSTPAGHARQHDPVRHGAVAELGPVHTADERRFRRPSSGLRDRDQLHGEQDDDLEAPRRTGPGRPGHVGRHLLRPRARQGLMNGPTALAITADGRVLVLEQGGPTVPGRIQAFDVNGNPVPSFDGAAITTVPTSHSEELNAGLVSADMRQAFAKAGTPLSAEWLVRDGTTLYQLIAQGGSVVVTSGGADLSLNWAITSGTSTYSLSLDGPTISVSQGGTALFTVPASLATKLNTGIATGPVTDAFKQNNITLTTPVKVSGHKLTLDPSVVADLVNGTVPGPLQHALIVRGMPSLSPKAKLSASVTVTVRDPGRLWTLQDLRTASSYKISLDPGGKQLDVVSLVPIAPLHDYVPEAGATYLSMAAEPKGHMYILSYTGDGSSPEDYQLDIYQPNGPWLTRTTGLNAARIVVDMWRNLYTLNYEAVEGPGARTEPSVSTWVPFS